MRSTVRGINELIEKCGSDENAYNAFMDEPELFVNENDKLLKLRVAVDEIRSTKFEKGIVKNFRLWYN